MKDVLYVPFGSDFINALHRFISNNDDMSQIAIVFAGKRPSLYLKKMLGRESNKPSYAPFFFSIEEFIDFIARTKFPDFTDIERMDAIFILYKSIQSLPAFEGHSLQKKSFGDFFHWGRFLLDFIDMIDLENITTEHLISLERNADLGYEIPDSTNQLLSNVVSLRNEFHRLLHENHLFTKGYKHLCALRSLSAVNWTNFKKIYFAGLFALTATEKQIVKSIFLSDLGEIVLEGNPWDWPILSAFLSYLGAQAQPLPSDNKREAHVNLHAAIDAHAEALIASGILRDKEPDKTALILPSPDTLFPLLAFSMDHTGGPYNISLGYPLSRTSLFDLISHVMNAQTQKRENERYPVNEYLSVVTHPFVRNLNLDTDLRSVLTRLEDLLITNSLESSLANKPLLTLEEIEAALADDPAIHGLIVVHDHFFRSFSGSCTLLAYARILEELLEFLLQNTEVRSFVLSGEIFKRVFEALLHLRSLHCGNEKLHDDELENRRTVCSLLHAHLNSLKIPFDTKPIENLEILGFLESRNISFDTVLIFDVNEGILPQPREVNPVIPLGIYDTLGIPSPDYNEEIFRYHFYRLIKSARHVHLFYTDTEGQTRSRYVEQIIWEKERQVGAIDILPVTRGINRINVHLRDVDPAVEKTDTILHVLQNKIFSPSVIDDYVTCPLFFYYKHLLHFEEKKYGTDNIDASDRGRLIHAILHDTFEGFKERELIPLNDEQALLLRLHQIIEKHMGNRGTSGDFYLFKKLTTFKLESFIRKQMKNISDSFVIKYLEQPVEHSIQTGNSSVAIHGIIDRIDYIPRSSSYRILDYKTGGTRQYSRNILKQCSFTNMKDIHDHIKSFQLPIYVHLFANQYRIPIHSMNASLVLLRNNSEEDLFAGFNGFQKNELLRVYLESLDTVFADLFNANKPFTAFDKQSCTGCSFNTLCNV